MDIPVEEKLFPSAVIPSGIGREHRIVLPGIGTRSENGNVGPGIIFNPRGLDKDAVSKHIDIRHEGEQLDFGIICPRQAFDYLAVGGAHRAASPEHGHTVLGIVVQIPGPQHIAVLVLKLHKVAPELCEVILYEICELVAGQLGIVLENLHVAHCLDDIGVDIPERRVTEQVCIVVEKPGRSRHLAVGDAALLDELH